MHIEFYKKSYIKRHRKSDFLFINYEQNAFSLL